MHHRLFHRRGFAFYHAALAVAQFFSAWTSGIAKLPETTQPVWVVSNGFHTSLAFRVGDLPFGREIAGAARADAVLVGWGAADFYRGRMNAWTFFRALTGSASILHVVPVRGGITLRFAHSDVVELRLTPAQLRALAAQLDRAFARGKDGQRIVLGRGYFPESRFYAGRERFYFPKMCNVWIAQKLRGSGLPISVPASITAGELTRQVARFGEKRQRLQRPVNAI